MLVRFSANGTICDTSTNRRFYFYGYDVFHSFNGWQVEINDVGYDLPDCFCIRTACFFVERVVALV